MPCFKSSKADEQKLEQCFHFGKQALLLSGLISLHPLTACFHEGALITSRGLHSAH